MKILWYVNIVMPKASENFGLKKNNAAGWLIEQSKKLAKEKDMNLVISNITPLVKEKKEKEDENIKYILLPINDYKKHFENMLRSEHPDLVHIHGTEYDYNTCLVNLCKEMNIKFVVSIQGILSLCADRYMDGLPEKFNKISIPRKIMKNLYYADSIKLSQKDFYLRGKKETKALEVTKNVIGRTHWDKSHVTNVNKDINYFHVNENLRKEFYTNEEWNYENCQKYSIFLSQGFYPIKGFHQLLKIMPKLIKRYPDIKIYVGGQKPYSLNNEFLDVFVDYFFEYQSYIKKEIKKNKLEKYIIFTGSLNAKEMKEMFLKSNVFLSCSTIENSPNSVGEAMILAVPIVASDVGGVSTILENEKEGLLYDFFNLEEMFNDICRVFDDKNLALELGINAKKHAINTHNLKVNTNDLLNAYKEILNEYN